MEKTIEIMNERKKFMEIGDIEMADALLKLAVYNERMRMQPPTILLKHIDIIS